jgi:hypothetical protein
MTSPDATSILCTGPVRLRRWRGEVNPCAQGLSSAVWRRISELAGRDLSHAADAAVAGELVEVLDALTAR